ncbi:MAG: hypothetical protein KH329_02135 [Bifidobacterium longum]|nr:hypothetical protein [Bifidobacterium longum]MBS6515013.1 hypothetical protein [Bifidobacterium longum]
MPAFGVLVIPSKELNGKSAIAVLLGEVKYLGNTP